MDENLNMSERANRFKTKVTFKGVMKLLVALVIFTVYGLIFGRIYLADNHGVMDRFSFDQNTVSTYNETTEFLTQTLENTMDSKGYFKISNVVYIPDHREMQLNVRYNDSTLDALNEYYPHRRLTDQPFAHIRLVDLASPSLINQKFNFRTTKFYPIERSELDSFVFMLSDGEKYYNTSYSYISAQNLLYNFRKLRFVDVDLEAYDKLYIYIYPSNHITSRSPMSKQFKIYDSESNTYESDLKVKFGSKPDAFIQAPDFNIGLAR